MEDRIPDGWDIVLVARSVTPGLPLNTVKKDLAYALKKLGVTVDKLSVDESRNSTTSEKDELPIKEVTQNTEGRSI